MKLNKVEHKGLFFICREGYSDRKTFDEVIVNETYLKKGMTIEPGERWMDCGANVGAFAVLAASKGAMVTCYEPDPANCRMTERNLKENNLNAEIKNVALVHDETRKANLYVGNNKNVWRNSLVKNWNGKGIVVDCINFDEEAKGFDCCKMDIEGAEMPILEHTEKKFKKMVYEWSFDIDPSLPRFWGIIEKQQAQYSRMSNIGNTARMRTRDYDTWQRSWFPACANVFCYND